LAGRLVKPFAHVSETTFGCYLVFGPEMQGQPDVVAFRDWLVGEIAGFSPAMDRFAASEPLIIK
jgi:DNA-binding transcriptional LysR family regulator